jgi:pimeloyl-ACP methyl ester carboxylesterase
MLAASGKYLMTTPIFYIHGFNSSSHSFAYLESKIAESPQKINYDSRSSLEEIVAHVLKQLPKDEPIILVGHSLGGIVALLIAGRKSSNVEQVITISSPLGGSKAAMFAQWIVTGVPLLSDITPTAKAIKELASFKELPPVLSLISTSGSLSTSLEPNDSVVTVASQKAFPLSEKIEISANHFEILLHEKTISIIQTVIERA